MLYTLKNQDACIHLLLYVYKKMGQQLSHPGMSFKINITKNNQRLPGLLQEKS